MYLTLMEPEKRRDFQVAEMAEETVLDATEMCAVEIEYGTAWSTVSSNIWSVFGDVLDNRKVTGHMQKAKMRAFVHSAMIEAQADALQKNDNCMIPSFEKAWVCEKESFFPKQRSVSYPHRSQH